MRLRQGTVLETLRRAQQFLDDNQAALVGITPLARQALDESVARLTSFAIDQKAGRTSSKGATEKQRALRALLRSKHMKPIALVARAKLRAVPEFNALRMPPFAITAARLIAAAEDMAEQGAKYESVFIECGLKPDFAKSLVAAADAVKASVDERNKNRGRQVGGTAGLESEQKQGRAALRLLDACIVPILDQNDPLLAEWRSVRHIPHKPGVTAGSSPKVPEPATTPATPTPSTTAT